MCSVLLNINILQFTRVVENGCALWKIMHVNGPFFTVYFLFSKIMVKHSSVFLLVFSYFLPDFSCSTCITCSKKIYVFNVSTGSPDPSVVSAPLVLRHNLLLSVNILNILKILCTLLLVVSLVAPYERPWLLCLQVYQSVLSVRISQVCKRGEGGQHGLQLLLLCPQNNLLGCGWKSSKGGSIFNRSNNFFIVYILNLIPLFIRCNMSKHMCLLPCGIGWFDYTVNTMQEILL